MGGVPNDTIKEFFKAASQMRGGPGGFVITSWATFAGPYASKFEKPFDYPASFVATAFLLVGFVLMTVSAIRGILGR